MDLSERPGMRSSRHDSGDSSSSDDAVLLLSYEGDMIVMPKQEPGSSCAQTAIKREPEDEPFEAQVENCEPQGEISERVSDFIKSEVKEEVDDNQGEDPYCEVPQRGRFSRAPTISEADLPPDIFDYRAGSLYRCKFCPHKVRTRRQLLLHIERHIRNASLQKCKYCDFITSMSQKLKEHEWKHTDTKPYKCRHCPYRSRVLLDLKRHQDKHNVDKPYACPKCDFRTKWRKGLSKHMEIHQAVRTKPHACPHCNLAFRYSSALRTHLFRRHTDIKPLQCDQCSYRCKSNFELRSHKAKHGNDRPYKCTHPGCGMAYKTKSDCTKHMWKHKDKTKYSCDICGKGFKLKMGLNKHAVAHSEERNFECHHCMKKFKTLATLQTHVQTHLEVKPHRCDVCFKTFTSRSNLLTHRQVHEGDRPFKCPMCVYGGRELEHLLVHIGGEHLGEFTYVCSVCRKPFSRSMQLQTHLKTCHRQEMGDTEMELVYDPQYLDLDFHPENHDLSALQQLTTAELTAASKSSSTENDAEEKSLREEESLTAEGSGASANITSMADGEDGDMRIDGEIDLPVSAALLAPPPVVQICLYGGLKFCMARRGSGFTFNHQKRGKKCKSWFMNPEFMSAEDAEKHKEYLHKKGQGLLRARRRKPKTQSYEWSGRRQTRAAQSAVSVELANVSAETSSNHGKVGVKVRQRRKRKKSWRHVESSSDSEDEASVRFHRPSIVTSKRDKMERTAASAAAVAVAAVFDVEHEHISSPEKFMRKSGGFFADFDQSSSHAALRSADVGASPELHPVGIRSTASVSTHHPYPSASEDNLAVPSSVKQAKLSKAQTLKGKQTESVKNHSTTTQRKAQRRSSSHLEIPAQSSLEDIGTRDVYLQTTEPSNELLLEGNIKREPVHADTVYVSESGAESSKAAIILDRIRASNALCSRQSHVMSSQMCRCKLNAGNVLERDRCLHVVLSDICADHELLEFLKSYSLNTESLYSGCHPQSERAGQPLRRKGRFKRSSVTSAVKQITKPFTGKAKKLSKTLAQSKAQEQGVGALLIATASSGGSAPSSPTNARREPELTDRAGESKMRRKGRPPLKIIPQTVPAASASAESQVHSDKTVADDPAVSPCGVTIKTEPVETDVSDTLATQGGALQSQSNSGGQMPLAAPRKKVGRPRKLNRITDSPSHIKSEFPDESHASALDHVEANVAIDSVANSLNASSCSTMSSAEEYSPEKPRKSDRPHKIRPPVTHPHSQAVLERLKQALGSNSPSKKIPGIRRLGILPKLHPLAQSTPAQSLTGRSVSPGNNEFEQKAEGGLASVATEVERLAMDVESTGTIGNGSCHQTVRNTPQMQVLAPSEAAVTPEKSPEKASDTHEDHVDFWFEGENSHTELQAEALAEVNSSLAPSTHPATCHKPQVSDAYKELTIVISPVHHDQTAEPQVTSGPSVSCSASSAVCMSSEISPAPTTPVKLQRPDRNISGSISPGQKIDQVIRKLGSPCSTASTDSAQPASTNTSPDNANVDAGPKTSENVRKRKADPPRKRGKGASVRSGDTSVCESPGFSGAPVHAKSASPSTPDDAQSEQHQEENRISDELERSQAAQVTDVAGSDSASSSTVPNPPTKRKVGRPRKDASVQSGELSKQSPTAQVTETAVSDNASTPTVPTPVPKRKVGRPPKVKPQSTSVTNVTDGNSSSLVNVAASSKESSTTPPKKVGRQRKDTSVSSGGLSVRDVCSAEEGPAHAGKVSHSDRLSDELQQNTRTSLESERSQAAKITDTAGADSAISATVGTPTPKKKVGRPPKKRPQSVSVPIVTDNDGCSLADVTVLCSENNTTQPKKMGRPRKDASLTSSAVSERLRNQTAQVTDSVAVVSDNADSLTVPTPAPKKKVGRPPKIKSHSTSVPSACGGDSSSSANVTGHSEENKITQPKRVGRPPKQKPVGKSSSESVQEHAKKTSRQPRNSLSNSDNSGGSKAESSSDVLADADVPSRKAQEKEATVEHLETLEHDFGGKGIHKGQTKLLRKGSRKIKRTKSGKKFSQFSTVGKKAKPVLSQRKQNSAFKIIKPHRKPVTAGGRKSKDKTNKQKKKYMYVELDMGLSPDHTPVKKRMGRPPGPKVIMDRSQANLCFSPFTPPILSQEQSEGSFPAENQDLPPPVLQPELDESIPLIDKISPADVTTERRERRRSERLQQNRDQQNGDALLSPPVLQPEMQTEQSNPNAGKEREDGGDGSDVEFVDADYSRVDLSEQRLPLPTEDGVHTPENVEQTGNLLTNSDITGDGAVGSETVVTGSAVLGIVTDAADESATAVIKTDVDAVGNGHSDTVENDVVDNTTVGDLGLMKETAGDMINKDVDVMRNSNEGDTDSMTDSVNAVVDADSSAGTSLTVIKTDVDVTNDGSQPTAEPQVCVNVANVVKVEEEELVKDVTNLPDNPEVTSSETAVTEGVPLSLPPVLLDENSAMQTVKVSDSSEQTCEEETAVCSSIEDSVKTNANDQSLAEQNIQISESNDQPCLEQSFTPKHDSSNIITDNDNNVPESQLNSSDVGGDAELPSKDGGAQEAPSTSGHAWHADESNSHDGLNDDHQEMDNIPADSGLSSISSAEMSEGEVHPHERDLSPQCHPPHEEFPTANEEQMGRKSAAPTSDFVLEEVQGVADDHSWKEAEKVTGVCSGAVVEATSKSQITKVLPDDGQSACATVSSDISEEDRAAIQISLDMENNEVHNLSKERDAVEEMTDDLITESTSLMTRDSDPENTCNPSSDITLENTAVEIADTDNTDQFDPKSSFIVRVVGDIDGEGKEVVIKELDCGASPAEQSNNMLLLEVVEKFTEDEITNASQTETGGAEPTKSEAEDGNDRKYQKTVSLPNVSENITEQDPAAVVLTDETSLSSLHQSHSQSIANKRVHKPHSDRKGSKSNRKQRMQDTTISSKEADNSETKIEILPQTYAGPGDFMVEAGLVKVETDRTDSFYPHHVQKSSNPWEKNKLPSFESATGFTWVKREYCTEGNVYGHNSGDGPQDRPIMINIQAPSVNVYSNVLHTPADMPVHSHSSMFDPNSVLNFSRSCAVTTDTEPMRSAMNFGGDCAQGICSENEGGFPDISAGSYLKDPASATGFHGTFPSSMAGVPPHAAQSSFDSSVPPAAFSEAPAQLDSVSGMCSDSANIVWQACQEILLSSSQPLPKPSDVMLAGQDVMQPPPPYVESQGISSAQASFQLPQLGGFSGELTETGRGSSSAAPQMCGAPYSNRTDSAAAGNGFFSATMRPLFRVDSREDSLALSCPNESLGPFDDQYEDFSVSLSLEPDEDCDDDVSKTFPDMSSGSASLQ